MNLMNVINEDLTFTSEVVEEFEVKILLDYGQMFNFMKKASDKREWFRKTAKAEDIQRERVNNLGKWKLKILTPLLLLVGNVSRLEVLSERTAIQGLNLFMPPPLFALKRFAVLCS